jgi:peptidyl-prolyl cis-trans isomerase C
MGKRLIVALMMTGSLFFVGSEGLTADDKSVPENTVPDVIAKVNGKTITAGEYKRMWAQMAGGQSTQGLTKQSKAQEALKKSVTERLVVLELLAQKADLMKIEPEPGGVEEKIQSLQNRFGGKDGFEKQLKARGIELDQFKADVAKSLKIQKLLDVDVFDKITVENGEVKRFYEENPEKFEMSEQVQARHIIIRVPQTATKEQREQAKKAIQDAADRVRKGEAFEEVAKDVSQDGSAAKGGDLGYFSRGEMVPAFDEAAFSLKKGEVSEIVETRFGYHVIRVEDKRPAGKQPFEEAKPMIMAFLKRKEGKERVKKYVESLKSNAEIEVTAF